MAKTSENQELLFKVEKVDPIVLFGVGDQNLEVIERYIPVQLIARGNQVKIRGEAATAAMAKEILSEMVFIANKNQHLSRDDVETLVHVVTAGQSTTGVKSDQQAAGMPSSELGEVILFTKGGYIKARTAGQRKVAEAIGKNDLVVVIGPAGTGKTFLAVAFAVAALKEKQVQKIVLARPAVEAGESLGYLPGDYKEKIDPYLRPLYDALEDMLPRDLIKKYLEQSIIEVIPLAFMRGRTLNNAFVILDESQNATSMQMKMFLTRLGVNSKAIVNGDVTQIDLPDQTPSGLLDICQILKGVDGIEFVNLSERDVVRHRLVRDIIAAYDQRDKQNKNESEETRGE